MTRIARSIDLVIVHLYPDLLLSYGDRGNVMTLARRAGWRGFSVQVIEVSRGDRLPPHADLVVIGGGSDRIQSAVESDLVHRHGPIASLVANGAVVFGVCGGYQLLGHHYVGTDGYAIEGLGLLDVVTVAGRDRIVGPLSASGRFDGTRIAMVGFQNHAGRTTLGSEAVALAHVSRGQGNNGLDGTEGAVQGTVLGTYLHGPVLPTAPQLADGLLARALVRVTGGGPLQPLDDAAELRAAGLDR